jgi:hypothetical protein
LTSTLPEVRPDSAVRRSRIGRRLGVTALAVFVLLGALGLFGVRTATRTVTGGGYRLSVVYPSVARPALAVRVEVEVQHPGGFDGPVHLRMSSSYAALFDLNGFVPDPDTVTTTSAYTIYSFAPPPGDTFKIRIDTRVEPARQRGERAEVSVLDDAGAPVATVHFRTRIWP